MEGSRFGQSWRYENQPKSCALTVKSVKFRWYFRRIFFEFVEISSGSAEISLDLVRSRQIRWRFHGSSWELTGNSWELTGSKKLHWEMLSSRFGRVSSGFGEKTHQLTCHFWVLEAEICRWPSLVSGWPVVGPDRTGLGVWVGSWFYWTPLLRTMFVFYFGWDFQIGVLFGCVW